MKILFLGSDNFSLIVLKKIINSKHSVCAIITQPPRPSGRGHKLEMTEINKFAVQNNITVFAFERLSRNIDEIKKIHYDIAVVASYGQILSDEFLAIKPCINVHPSLLPKYRGATPIQSAILNGDKETGVTIMKVAKEVDSGDIILQERVLLNDNLTTEELEVILAQLGGELAIQAIDLYQEKRVKFTPQDHSKATFVQKLSKQDGYLDFNKSKNEIFNRFRALGENTGCYIFVDGQRIRVLELKKLDFDAKVNQIAKDKKRLIIGCKDGAIEILRLQSLSGKNVDAQSFLNGFKGKLEITQCLPT